MMSTIKKFSTADRYLISWLRYQDFPFVDITVMRDGGKPRVEFVYEDTEELQGMIRDYRNKVSYDMSPYVFVKEISSVTDIIHQELKRQ